MIPVCTEPEQDQTDILENKSNSSAGTILRSCSFSRITLFFCCHFYNVRCFHRCPFSVNISTDYKLIFLSGFQLVSYRCLFDFLELCCLAVLYKINRILFCIINGLPFQCNNIVLYRCNRIWLAILDIDVQ